MGEDEGAKEKAGRFNYGIIKYTDVPDENKLREMQDICTLACEKFAAGDKISPTSKLSLFELQPPAMRDNERCAGMMADNLSKKFGPGWNAVVGEAYSFEISYTKGTLMYMYFGGHLGICVWKAN